MSSGPLEGRLKGWSVAARSFSTINYIRTGGIINTRVAKTLLTGLRLIFGPGACLTRIGVAMPTYVGRVADWRLCVARIALERPAVARPKSSQETIGSCFPVTVSPSISRRPV